ncbi:MAG TPA: leucyl aminopeptidase family protein, partial [Alphaproteobacteria bacterium]|nr:leucyl aminopeptidase family protein [Alphaproteobacteria bacterium]
EFNWGKAADPLVILVGKGVCFDTGGLDLKPSQFMRNMKKDMGGAASVLSLAHIIIQCKLRVNLKVLIPAVNNDIGPSSMRPGDVYNSRFGITVEIGNTDAEGRLILADTLTYADSFKPKLLIDFATLTGAARVALGPDLPAYFTHSEELASLINKISIKEYDPLWRLPLHSPYESWLNSEVADTNNISQGSFAGAIIAALFLNKFVKSSTNWIHIDTYAWSDKNRPGHSKGGDILGVRSIYQLIKEYINSL